ncbi:NAD(P)H-dependent oxidoreductase [Chamaesiphon sp. OTE_8_metabat_110]|uniref:FMN-dependent NADH-azoreductase n=1 Tax=Chamaesiphon sp. OTE_8_metabat_110 TaxID=2964696 RepID=UPI00286D1C12|nr:NAD(P)H-dependent oxidoreductase [Chamaesiphon sp. OTE_8_metabat_110]
MTNLLQIDTSKRTGRSISRLLAKEFVEQWIASNPDSIVTYRDISQFPISHITAEWMDAEASSSSDRSILDSISELFSSKELVDELLLNDRYLISLPILNFIVPSTLKTYIDLIARTNLAVTENKHDSQGLLHGKKLLAIANQINNYPRNKNQDEVIKKFESYFRYIFEYIGVTDINFIYAYNQSEANLDRDLAIANARISINNFISDW